MKFKIIYISILMVISQSIFSQKLISKTGHVWFYSHTPIEDIEAHNRQSVSILDTETGTIQFTMLIKSFEFQKKLMQEHFNENYMESDTYPKASFVGNITNISEIDFSRDGEYTANVFGNLTIHGVTREVDVTGIILVKSGVTSAHAEFIVLPADFDIAIPDFTKNKIAEEITVTIDVVYNKN